MKVKPKITLCLALVLSSGLPGCSTATRSYGDVQSPKVAAVAKLKLKFVKVDSEETESQDGHGANAVDGNPNTYWHTQWQGTSPGLPHEIIIELLPPSVIKGFSYLPRQDASDHGAIKDYEFYVSDDGRNFGQPVKIGAFEPGKGEKIETFEPVKCRFIKLKAISEINGLPWTSAAEIGVIQNDENVDLMTNPINKGPYYHAPFTNNLWIPTESVSGPRFPVLPPITNADPAIRVPLVIQVPTRLSIQRTTGGLSANDSLTVEIDRNSLETTNLMAGTNMVTGVESRYFVYPEGEARPANGGYGLGGTDFNLGTSIWNVNQDGLPQPGKKYVVELALTVFETDIPPQQTWDPHGKNYKILWQRTLKQEAPETDTFMAKIIRKIEQQFPELAFPEISSGNSSPGETWKGEEFAASGFIPPNNARAFASVTIHRYGSAGEEQQDIERNLFRERQQGPDLKENYKGAVLYRWSAGRGGVVCQAGLYMVEIWSTREGGTPLEMKMLDVVLGELEAAASTPK